MAYIDCVEVHNKRKANGDSYIDPVDGSTKKFMLKKFDPNTGIELPAAVHATFSKEDLEGEIARLQNQVDALQAFASEQFPA